MSKKHIFITGLVLILLAGMFLVAGCGSGQQTGPDPDTDGEPDNGAVDFPTKGISLVISAGPGGGYDVLARGLAPYLSKHLPGNPIVTVVNMPGADHQKATYYMKDVPPDGHTISLFNLAALSLAQTQQDVGFDLNDFAWFGRGNEDRGLLAVAPDSPYQTWEDFENADQIIIATSGITSSASLCAILLFDVFMGKELILIPHDSSPEGFTSVMRGDTHASFFALSSTYPLIQSGELIPVLQFGREPHESIPDVLTVLEAGYEDLAVFNTNRIFGAPPGTPEEIVKILEKALLDAQNDPELIAWSQEGDRPINPLTAAETAELVEINLRLQGDYADELQAYFDKAMQ